MVSFPVKQSVSSLGLPLLLLGANSVIIAAAPAGLAYAAALLLLLFLPGWVWLPLFLARPAAVDGARASAPFDWAEQLILAAGLSLALTIFGTMLAVYLPGALDQSKLLITVNAIILSGLAATWLRRAAVPTPARPAAALVVVLITLLLLAALLRLPHLGYAEFHEDEAEALMLGVRLMQGEDYALFLHRKGPAQMLVPLAFWLLTGQITETMARFPFALSSVLSVAVLFLLGRRWFNWQTGLLAALLWAINGYGIAFGRMVQYQALIFFLGPLALYCLYWAGAERERLRNGLYLGAILLAACLLAHFDALLLLPAAAYLAGIAVRRKDGERRDLVVASTPLSTVLGAFALFLALLASFYIPYFLDPEFENTANYLANSRVKPGLLYNNLDLLWQLDQDYSSPFYLPLLGLGILVFVLWPGPAGGRWGNAFTNSEARAAWLMFGAGFVGYVFLVEDPRTHLYIMYPGAALLAGAGWQKLNLGFSLRGAAAAFLLGGAVSLVIFYEAIIFLLPEARLAQLRQQWDSSIGLTVYNNLPAEREYFGYPKREGWKGIGALRAQGLLPGDFRSANEDFIIPIWYNFGQARSCYDTPAHYFVRTSGDSFLEPTAQGYQETARIEREAEVRLRVFSAGAPAGVPPTVYQLESLEPLFDQLATPHHFIRRMEPAQPTVSQFGPAIQFLGYDLPSASVAPGETLHLNLYWRALQPPGDNYRAFVHLTDGSQLWGQQDDNPACRLPTPVWRAGQRGLGQFRLRLKPETPPGRYPLIIGLYQADTLERLKITAGAGQVGDDFLWLGDVEVREK